MNIYALSTKNSDFNGLLAEVGKLIPIQEFDDNDALALGVSEAAAVLLDLDDNQRNCDKLIKKLRKLDPEVPIFVLSTNLDAKKMTKHQAGKSSVDLYFSYPIDGEVLKLMLSEYFDFGDNVEVEVGDDVVANPHEEAISVSDESKNLSDSLDNVFSGVYVDEYSGSNEGVLAETDPSSAGAEEFSLDEDVSSVDHGVGMSAEIDLSVGDSSDDDLEIALGEDFSDDAGEKLETSDADPGLSEINLDEDLSLGEEGLDLGDESLDLGDESLDLGDESLDLGAVSESAGETTPSMVFDLGDDEDDADIDAALDLSSESQSSSEDDVNTSAQIVTDLGVDTDDASGPVNLDTLFDNDEDPLESSDLSLGNDDDGLSLGDVDLLDEEDKTIVGVGLTAELVKDESVDHELTVTKTNLLAQNIPLGDDDSPIETLIEDGDGEHEFLNENTGINDESTEQVVSGKKLPDSAPNIDDELDYGFDSLDDLSEAENFKADPVAEEPVVEEIVTLEPVVAVAEAKAIVESESESDDTKAAMEVHDHIASNKIKEEHRDYVQTHNEELIRMGETIQNLREDREMLIEKVAHLEDTHHTELNDFLGLKAQLDERKIEIEVLKKRYKDQIEDLKLRYDLAADKKAVLETKNKYLQEEFDKLSRDKRVDINNIRHRERELEEKLELLRADAEIQIRNRDHKILDLKRRIDTLEFDIENVHISEKRTKSGNIELEEKMNQVIRTLRGAITQLEEESDLEERKKIIKDNLDL